MDETRYWYVEYYQANSLHFPEPYLDHNAIVSSFNEFAELAQGRIGIITGEATEQAYLEYKAGART